jgi:hypothetical protein
VYSKVAHGKVKKIKTKRPVTFERLYIFKNPLGVVIAQYFLTYCANLKKIGGFIAPPICGVGAD